MRWLYRLQHRLALTAVEGTALFAIAAALAAGSAVRGMQGRDAAPAAALFAADARFATLDRAARAAPLAPPESPALHDVETGHVPAPDSAGAGPTASASSGPVADPPRRTRARQADPAPGSINLNTAGAAELERLPRIGPALAARILEYRRTNGPFRRVEELENVRGIGPRTRERLAPFVRL